MSLHKLTTSRRKRLKPVILFGSSGIPPGMLKDVNKREQLRDILARALFTAT